MQNFSDKQDALQSNRSKLSEPSMSKIARFWRAYIRLKGSIVLIFTKEEEEKTERKGEGLAEDYHITGWTKLFYREIYS